MNSLLGLTSNIGFNIEDNLGFISDITAMVNGLGGSFSNLDSVKVTSFLLIGAAFLLLLLMLCILYIKSMIISNTSLIGAVNSDKEEFYKKKLEDEKAKKRELLAKEKEAQKAEQEKIMEQERIYENKIEAELERTMIEERVKKEELAAEEEKKEAEKKENEKKNSLKLDWNKQQIKNNIKNAEAEKFKSASYVQPEKNLTELTGLIINMIARDVGSEKIAQTLSYKTNNKSSEEEILQLISSIENVIRMSNQGGFRDIVASHPSNRDEKDALQYLANGDPSIVLMLLEEKIDSQIIKSGNMSYGPMKVAALTEAAQLSCDFGTLASLKDGHLAINSLELATELQPKNVNAWSRLADNYLLHDTQNKAIWAYQNVLSIADKETDLQLIANANYKLGNLYIAQGNDELGKKMVESAKGYYDYIGINRNLSDKEKEIISIIEDRHQGELEDTIDRLLIARNSKNTMRRLSESVS